MNVEALQELVKDYLSKFQTRTQQKLCSKAGIKTKNLQRIMNGETKNPGPETIYALLNVIYDQDQSRIFTFFSEHAHEHIEKIERFYKISEYDLKDSAGIIDRMTGNQFFYLTSILLTAEKGVTRAFIRDNVGDRGLVVLNTLISENCILSLEGDRFRLSSNKIGTMDPTALKSMVIQAAGFHEPSDFRTDRAAIFHQSRWVSEEGRAAVKALLEDMNTRIAELCEKYPGDYPVAFYLGMSSLTTPTTGDDQ